MNDYLLEWTSCQYVWMRIYPYAHMCEMNPMDICPSEHAYIQMGVYITLFSYVCAYMYVCVEVLMLIHVIFG